MLIGAVPLKVTRPASLFLRGFRDTIGFLLLDSLRGILALRIGSRKALLAVGWTAIRSMIRPETSNQSRL